MASNALAGPFTLFESGQVRPLAMSPNGRTLFAVNTADNQLEIFQVKNSGLVHRSSVPVGLEPVAIGVRSDEEVWVVNHLSDSVSVVHVDPEERSGVVARTLLVGDEPRDIVFAGHNKSRAFITAAHRGQNVPFDPQLTTPGIGRADVWVFAANNLGTSMGGDPLTIITLFGDTPRALAATPDGSRVYAAIFHSGNRSTAIHETVVPNGGEAAGGVPGPNVNHQGVPAPEVSILVHHNGQNWVDALDRTWNDQVRINLPDKDVFAINALANPPAPITGNGGVYTGVGTILFNMAVNPVNGKVYVSNTEARNDLRFEGPAVFGPETLRGHLHESRISVLSASGTAPRHLNKHIDYDTCCEALPNSTNEKTLAQPMGMAITNNGATLYVAAFGSSKIGIYSTAQLEANTFVPNAAQQITLSGGGPTGMVLDESRNRMYVLTRFNNAIAVVNTNTKTEIASVSMHNPEPVSVVEGRAFLYDAKRSSGNGEAACGSCHIFGDFDSLSWDLGNPDGDMLNNPSSIVPLLPEFGGDPTFGLEPDFHPMKGPLTTQSLRGMANHGPMHWRGDRTGGNDEASAQPNDGIFDEHAGFTKFNGAFTGLLGRNSELTQAEMAKFTNFTMQIMYPPNPIRSLDNSLTPAQAEGRDFFEHTVSFFNGACENCHRLDPNANPSEGLSKGFFGSDGQTSFAGEPMLMKVPHLRNLYQKVGMFGAALRTGSIGPDANIGDQVRGFGFNSDGTVPTLFRFVSFFDFDPIFNQPGFPLSEENTLAKKNIEQFLLAFDSNLAPIVGQQVTLTASTRQAVRPRIDLLKDRADHGECDLVAKGRFAGFDVGFLYTGNGQFKPDREQLPLVSDAFLRASAVLSGGALTYTCTPPGSGQRMGIDRDLDGVLDGDERAQGSDPANANSTP